MHEDFDSPPSPADPQSVKRGHEFRDMNLRGVVLFLAVFFAVGLLVHIIVWISFRNVAHTAISEDPKPSPLAVGAGRPPEPILQPTQNYHEKQPWQDLQEMHQRENAHLNNYAWVDQKAGVVRIPIGRAMELVVDHGLPVAGSVEPPASIKPSH